MDRKVRVKNLEKFKSAVFGADCFLKNHPEILTTGILIRPKKIDNKKWYYVINTETNQRYDISDFFTAKEVQYYLEDVKEI